MKAMDIVLNGDRERLDAECTVADLLAARGLGRTPCAVEVNEQLVPKARHAEHVLAEGDRVEIVTLVGGG